MIENLTAGDHKKKKESKLPLPDIAADELVNTTHSGWLTKRGGSIVTWKKRWFILKGRCMYHFAAKSGSKCLGIIVLPSYHVCDPISFFYKGLTVLTAFFFFNCIPFLD